MIVTGFDQCGSGSAARSQEFLALFKRNDLIFSGVQDHGAWLHHSDAAPPFPCGTKKYQWCRTGLHIHRECSTTAGTDNHIRPTLVEFGLSNTQCLTPIIIGKG